MNEKVFATLKSTETEDWFDLHIVRPFSYRWAAFFARIDVHPNTVTVMSMIIGAASCLLFAHGSFYYEGVWGIMFNIIALLLLFCADILDCTDGQLARMTGKKSRLGRILDGVAGFAWYIPIYFGLVYRFYQHHSLEFDWLGIDDTAVNTYIATFVVMCLGFVAGFAGLAPQQRIADYYIQIHLFFLKGEKGSELDNSKRQQELYDELSWKDNKLEKFFQKTYVDYTIKQEKATPEFQALLAKLKETYGSFDNIPNSVRKAIHDESLPLMKYVTMLVFNFRTISLALFCLLDVPIAHFLFEAIAISALAFYVNHRHERFCKKIAQSLK